MTLLFTRNRVIHCVVYEVIEQVLCGLVSEKKKKSALRHIPLNVFSGTVKVTVLNLFTLN